MPLVATLATASCVVSHTEPSNESTAGPSPSSADIGCCAERADAMISVPKGKLLIGATDLGHMEKPVHWVEVEAFAIDATEVTVGQWAGCVDAGVCGPPRGGPTSDAFACAWRSRDRMPHRPVNCVSWKQAALYCEFAGGKRLPLEEEWEYAARGADFRKYPWGNDAPDDQLCWQRAGKTATCAVGDTAGDVSAFGLRDMGGNVREWTQSPYCSYHDRECDTPMVVVRGGGWRGRSDYPRLVRTAKRMPSSGSASNDVGFRCARSL